MVENTQVPFVLTLDPASRLRFVWSQAIGEGAVYDRVSGELIAELDEGEEVCAAEWSVLHADGAFSSFTAPPDRVTEPITAVLRWVGSSPWSQLAERGHHRRAD